MPPPRAAGPRRVALPLFDRLLPPAAEAPATLRESVARELDALMNTRLPVPMAALEGGEPRTTLNYGLPDLSAFPVGSLEGKERLIRSIEAAILAYEPRLRAPRVRAIAQTGPDSLAVEITGTLAATGTVSFTARVARGGAGLQDDG